MIKRVSLLFLFISISYSQTYEWVEVGYTSRLPHDYTFFVDSIDQINTYDWNYRRNYVSTDNGKTWEEVDSIFIKKIVGFALMFTDSTGRANEVTISYSDPIGIKYQFSDSSRWWYVIRDTLLYMSMPFIAYQNESNIFLTGGSLLFSSDGGIHWQPIDLFNKYQLNFHDYLLRDTLWNYYRDQEVTSTLVDKFDHILVSSSKYGIFYTTNNGSYWTRQNSGLTDTTVLILRKNSKEELLALTMSGKIFKGTAKPSSVNRKNIISSAISLNQNYPNPFNPTTTIEFTLLNQNNTSLKVYNILGQEIATLIDERLGSGMYSVPFRAEHLSSGIYFYVLRSDEFTQSKKMILMK